MSRCAGIGCDATKAFSQFPLYVLVADEWKSYTIVVRQRKKKLDQVHDGVSEGSAGSKVHVNKLAGSILMLTGQRYSTYCTATPHDLYGGAQSDKVPNSNSLRAVYFYKLVIQAQD